MAFFKALFKARKKEPTRPYRGLGHYTPVLTLHNLVNGNDDHEKIHDQDLGEKIPSVQSVSENIKTVSVYARSMYTSKTIPYLEHAWVVLETDGHHFWSMEKNARGVDVQVATELWQVKDQFKGKDRPNGIREVISGEGRGQVSDVLLAIYRQNLLGRPYHLLRDNCKYFASDIVKYATKEGIDCTVRFFGLLSHPMTVNVGPAFDIEHVGADTVHCYLRDARRWITDLSHPDTQVYMIGYIKALKTKTSDAVVILEKNGLEHNIWIMKTNSKGYNIMFDKGHTALEGLNQSKKYRLDNIATGIQGKAKFSKLFKQFDKIVSAGARSMKTILNSFFGEISSNDAYMTLKHDERENAIVKHCPAGVDQSMVRPFERSLERVRCLYQAIICTSLNIESKYWCEMRYSFH